mgnify:CR=1 FL=1
MGYLGPIKRPESGRRPLGLLGQLACGHFRLALQFWCQFVCLGIDGKEKGQYNTHLIGRKLIIIIRVDLAAGVIFTTVLNVAQPFLFEQTANAPFVATNGATTEPVCVCKLFSIHPLMLI